MIENLMQKELPECPFCGQKAKLYGDACGFWHVQCTSCGARTMEVRNEKTAVNMWGKRKPMEKAAEEIKKCRESLCTCMKGGTVMRKNPEVWSALGKCLEALNRRQENKASVS